MFSQHVAISSLTSLCFGYHPPHKVPACCAHSKGPSHFCFSPICRRLLLHCPLLCQQHKHDIVLFHFLHEHLFAFFLSWLIPWYTQEYCQPIEAWHTGKYLFRRILELLRLEKAFKTIMFNNQPIAITMFTTKPCPQSAESIDFVEELQGWWLTTSWAVCSNALQPFLWL